MSSSWRYARWAPASEYARSCSTTSTGVPVGPASRDCSTVRPVALARRSTSAASAPHTTVTAAGITTGGLAGAAHVVDLARKVGHRMEWHVELVGEARRERGRALRARTAQDEWRVWALDGLGEGG